MTEPDPQSEDAPGDPPAKPRRRWLRRLAMVCLVLVALLGLGGGGLALWIMDRPVSAPDWVRERVSERIARNGGGEIAFGDMVLTVQRGWRPQVELRDVRFFAGDGQEVLALSDMQASLAMRPLLDGKIQPRQVSMAGMFATLRRDDQGRVSLTTSSASGAGEREASNMTELVEQLDDVFSTPELQALSQVDLDGVTLRFEDARSRQAWTVDGARLRVVRDGSDLAVSGDLALLSGGADVATMEASYRSQIGSSTAEIGVTIQNVDAVDIAAFSPAFGWLDALRAPISGALRLSVEADGALAPINATLQIGQGVLQPTRSTEPIPFQSARTYFSFDPVENTLRFDELSLDSKWVKARGEGYAVLSGLETGVLEELVGQLIVTEITLDPPDLYKTPLVLDSAEMDFRLRPHPFAFDLGQLRVVDQERSINARGALRAAPQGWDLTLDANLAQITPDRLMQLWPVSLVEKTRTWLAQNVLDADLQDVDFALRAHPGEKPDYYLGFGFDNATVRFMKTMPPISAARGVGSLLRGRLALNVMKGRVNAPQGGAIDVGGSSFVIPDVTAKGGTPAEVLLKTDSTVTAALALLNQAPLNVMDKAKLPVTLADGRAELTGTLSFPIKPNMQAADVIYAATGVLRNVKSSTLIKDRTLAAPRLGLVANNDNIEITGAGVFDGIAFDGGWSQGLGRAATGASTVSAEVEMSPKAVAVLNLGLPKGSVTGEGRGQLTVELARGQAPQFALTSDLRGVGLAVRELGWSKGRNSAGTLEVSGQMGPEARVDAIALKAAGLEVTGSVSLRPGGGLQEARLSRVRVGNWLNAPVTLVGRGKGAAPAIEVRGGSLDMRQASFGTGSGSGTGGGAAGPLTLALNELRITDTIALTNMRGKFNLSKGLQGQFSGAVNGKAKVTGQVEPSQGRSAFRLKSGDAGAVFAAAGLLKQARGGTLSLILNPVGTAGAFNGSLTVRNTRVKDAPAIAALFNALSVVGLLEQMGGQGLHFGEVEAAFRLTPDRVTLTEASAVGPSIGLSMDGTYDVNTSQMNMRGVFSPIYLINGLGSVLTRRGEGLIGFNFRLTGPASGPKVQVNPLSALTPSIFRELFRRPAPKVEVEPGEAPNAKPKVQRTPRVRKEGRPLATGREDR